MVHLHHCACCFPNPQPTNQFSPVVGEYTRIADWAKSFDSLLEDADGVACFSEFLRKEYADENIKFWLACRDYELIPDQKQRHEAANKILSEYLVSGAPNPINIDAAGRDEVVRNCDAAPPQLFKPMQKQIYNLMMYGKYWQFTRSEVYLNLLEQEKLGKTPLFRHSAAHHPGSKEGKRRNVIGSDSSANSHRPKKFFNFFSSRKREEPLHEQPKNLPTGRSATHHGSGTVGGKFVLLEMPNCTFKRIYHSNGHDILKTAIDRALVNTGVNWNCYHVCVSKTGEVIDVNKPISEFANTTLSFYNTPTFTIQVCPNKRLKFCTLHRKTLKEIVSDAFTENDLDPKSVILFERESKKYVRFDMQSMLLANKELEVRDMTVKTNPTSRPSSRKSNGKANVRRSIQGGVIACHGSLESNLDLLSSVMESSDEETELPSSARGLIRSQSELEFFELLNRMQCDRLDNQRCSHPTVLKNLSLGRRNDSNKKKRSTSSGRSNGASTSRPASRANSAHGVSNAMTRTREEEIDYC